MSTPCIWLDNNVVAPGLEVVMGGVRRSSSGILNLGNVLMDKFYLAFLDAKTSLSLCTLKDKTFPVTTARSKNMSEGSAGLWHYVSFVYFRLAQPHP